MLIDHILRSSQKGVINVAVSDPQLIFCTSKISKIKAGGVHKYLNFLSLTNYTNDYYNEALKQDQTIKMLVMLMRLIQIQNIF